MAAQHPGTCKERHELLMGPLPVSRSGVGVGWGGEVKGWEEGWGENCSWNVK